jgi:hypothetical protein
MKKLALAATLAVACASANAGVVTAAGGVYWDALAGQPNFEATVDYTQWWTTDNTATGQDVGGVVNSSVSANGVVPSTANFLTLLGNGESPELVGVGEFFMNSSNGGNPSCASCEMTFAFGGVFLESIVTDTVTIGGATFPVQVPVINTDNAWLNLYLDTANPTEFDVSFAATATAATMGTEVAEATNGSLWLSTMLQDFAYTPDTSSQLFGQPLAKGSSSFFAAVTGGIAQNNFLGFFVGSDGSLNEASTQGLTSNFSDANDTIFANQNIYALSGDGTVQAATVSAPSTIAFMGLGLFGLAFAARRRNK